MTDLVPYTPRLPELSGPPSFIRLTKAIATLTSSALALKEGMWMLQRRMHKDADQVIQMADMCEPAEVEPQFTALIREASDALRKVAEASGGLVDAADRMEADARDFGNAHEHEYRGIYEANKASTARQAKPGFYETR